MKTSRDELALRERVLLATLLTTANVVLGMTELTRARGSTVPRSGVNRSRRQGTRQV